MTVTQKTPGPLSSSLAQSDILLERAIVATKQTDRLTAYQLIETLAEAASAGMLSWQKNVMQSIQEALVLLDQKISSQLAKVMHHPNFQALEGSWRGLQYLISQTDSSPNLKVRLLSVNKRELQRDLDKAVDFDQSQLYRKIYENEFGTPGGEPYGLLVGDYEFSHHPDDITMLRDIASVSAAAFCPFISASSPALFGFESWADLAKPRDLAKIFDTADYAKWRSFRETEDARFVALVMPRVLARLPYGKNGQSAESFYYEELMNESNYCWMNAAYVYAQRLTQAFAEHGWCTAIRGAEGGGKVENLPLYTFMSDDGDVDYQCPTEVGITDRREAELSRLGFLALCHYKNTDYGVFFGAQTLQKPKQYDTPEATANAQISARLPYMMATSRFSHYLKIMARDKVGSFMAIDEVESWLNRWIMNYANQNAQYKTRYPLAEAKISVKETPGRPGFYQAVAWLKPWLQMEELTTSMRLVADIPKVNG